MAAWALPSWPTAAAQTVLDQIGAEGGRALIVGLSDAGGGTGHGGRPDAPVPGAERLAVHVRGPARPPSSPGRCWPNVGVGARFPPGGFQRGRGDAPGAGAVDVGAELRQAPAVRQERVLASATAVTS